MPDRTIENRRQMIAFEVEIVIEDALAAVRESVDGTAACDSGKVPDSERWPATRPRLSAGAEHHKGKKQPGQAVSMD